MSSTLPKQERKDLDRLVKTIFKHYHFKHPPVPIETILQQPPEDLLNAVDISDLSMVFGVSEHRYEYRMAMARLLYREICRKRHMTGGDSLPEHADASRYFAAALLIPEKWVIRATRWPFVTLQELSENYQVPEYVMASRLVQLDRQVRGMQ